MDEDHVVWKVTLRREQTQEVILNDSFCAFGDRLADAAAKLARPDKWKTHEPYYDYETEQVEIE